MNGRNHTNVQVNYCISSAFLLSPSFFFLTDPSSSTFSHWWLFSPFIFISSSTAQVSHHNNMLCRSIYKCIKIPSTSRAFQFLKFLIYRFHLVHFVVLLCCPTVGHFFLTGQRKIWLLETGTKTLCGLFFFLLFFIYFRTNKINLFWVLTTFFSFTDALLLSNLKFSALWL